MLHVVQIFFGFKNMFVTIHKQCVITAEIIFTFEGQHFLKSSAAITVSLIFLCE